MRSGIRAIAGHFICVRSNKGIIGPLITFSFCVLILFLLQIQNQPYARNGIYFQEWGSEEMMQTVSIADLRDQPWQSILYLHIQPPLLDTIRLLFTQLWRSADPQTLVVRVDQNLYFLWMILYGLMGVIIYCWLGEMIPNRFAAFLLAILFILHPATIFYATFLEGTFLTAFGMLWLCYSLWKLPRGGSIWSLIFAYLLLFFVRSIFQWPALIMVIISLILRGVEPKKILTFVLVIGLCMAGYMAKQYLIFSTTSTSSFSGSSCLHSLHRFPGMGYTEYKLEDIKLGPLFPTHSLNTLPDVLTRSTKLTGVHNFNNLADLQNERLLLDTCKQTFLSQPVQNTIFSYFENLVIFFRASSQYYTSHAIVDRLFWRSSYDFVFSGIPLFLLLVISSVVWMLRHKKSDIKSGLGFILPVLYVFASCVLFEKLENMRYKFFIEPVLFIFIVSQMIQLIKSVKIILLERKSKLGLSILPKMQ